MWAITTVVPMPRLLLSCRTERTISWLARRMAFSTRRAGAGKPASSPLGERNEAGMVGSLRGSEPEMCLSIDSTARREATSPAACPPIPSATTKRAPSSEMANESSFDFRLRPTSLSPALSIASRPAPPSPEVLPLDTGPLFFRGRQLLELGERRLVVRLARQDRTQFLDGLLVVAAFGQGEGQVEPGERILRIRLQSPAKRGDRLVPAVELPQGDADVVVDIGEIRVELAGQAEILGRPLVLSLGQETQSPPVVEGEALRAAQERLAHPLVGIAAVAAGQGILRSLERFVDGPHGQVARGREFLVRLFLLAGPEQEKGELHARLEVAGVQRDGAPVALDRLEAQIEARVQAPHAEVD